MYTHINYMYLYTEIYLTTTKELDAMTLTHGICLKGHGAMGGIEWENRR